MRWKPSLIVPDTFISAHLVGGNAPDFHRGLVAMGSYHYPHRHLINERWSVGDKNALADHIDACHTPPTAASEAPRIDAEPKVEPRPTELE